MSVPDDVLADALGIDPCEWGEVSAMTVCCTTHDQDDDGPYEERYPVEPLHCLRARLLLGGARQGIELAKAGIAETIVERARKNYATKVRDNLDEREADRYNCCGAGMAIGAGIAENWQPGGAP